ncbi:hypothetical protein F0562_025157 [Nyssa sinensis]|uniref:Uncharacterized protein n=1 Tax=Nyssa sinensis TaxID=561372 RepID=A0A5J5BF11_9ASTE|nr:hypothetical protein F0562_025157 [Nyssa sinensis]
MKVAMSTLGKTASSSSYEVFELRRGPWTLEEDTLLIRYISCHGEGRWNLLAKRSGLRRTGKSCRLRWLNYLKPDVKHGNLTPQEQLLILELHSKWGNRWSKIAQHLPGRTDNEIKNYWRTRVQKQARHLKIDSNSTAFQEVIRCFWMPRLIQKIQGSSPSLAMSSQNSNAQPLNHANDHSILLSPEATAQGPFNITETAYSLDHQAMNSSSENCTSPSITSSESITISQIPQFSGYPTSPLHAMANSDFNTLLKGCSNVDNISYDMETFSLASVSAPGDFENLVRESNWIDNDLADSFWHMDELWQFRQLQGRGI